MKDIESVVLKLDEFEAFRLAHLEDMYQADAALQMNVSRQTYGNILASASKKIADAIVNGKALTIEGGIVEISGEATRHFRCEGCGATHELEFGLRRAENCPDCGSDNYHRI